MSIETASAHNGRAENDAPKSPAWEQVSQASQPASISSSATEKENSQTSTSFKPGHEKTLGSDAERSSEAESDDLQISFADIFSSPANRNLGAKSTPGNWDRSQLQKLGFPEPSIDFGVKGIELEAESSEKKPASGKYNVEGMIDYFQNNFGKFDTDGDGKITRAEIAEQIKKPGAKQEDGIYMSAMYTHAAPWQRASAAKIEDGQVQTPGITRESLDAIKNELPEHRSKPVQDKISVEALRDNFDDIDTNHDQCILESEVDAALNADGWSEDQKRGLQKLKDDFTAVADSSENWEPAFANSAPPVIQPRDENGDAVPNSPTFVSRLDLERYPDEKTRLINHTNQTIENTEDHVNNPHSADQANGNSCFLIANCEALQRQNPQALKDMIKDNGNGTVTVTFPGDPEHPVTVAKPTDAERARYSSNEDVSIIEKATAQYIIDNKKQEELLSPAYEDAREPQFAQELFSNHGGGSPDRAMRLLTGKETHNHKIESMSVEEIKTEMTHAANESGPFVATSNGYVDSATGVHGNHAYMAQYDPQTNQVTLTNPNKPARHGAVEPHDRQGNPSDGKNDGSFVMSLEKFKETFQEFHTSVTPVKTKVASGSAAEGY